MARTKKQSIEDRANSGYIDLTKTGPLSYRELRDLNNNLPNESVINAAHRDDPGVSIALGRAGRVNYTAQPTGLGESIYDPGIANQEQIENLQDYRAEEQPWYAQIGAGLAKGAILAGTTFLDGTVGLVIGGAAALQEGRWSALWDNDFSKAMQAINEGAEKTLINYYSEEEMNGPWYDNIFTANFLGDKLIKNFGFMVGAYLGGGVGSSILKTTRIPALVGAATHSIKAAKMVTSATGVTVGAINEARIEALNNSKDWQNLKMQELDDAWRDRLNANYAPEIEALRQEAEAAYKGFEATKGKLQRTGTGDSMSLADPATQKYLARMKAIEAREAALKGRMDAEWKNRTSDKTYNEVVGKIAEDRLKMGNADLLLNLPVLLFSNAVQLGKLYAGGFSTARRAGVKTITNEAVPRGVEYAGKKFSLGKLAGRSLKTMASEGSEEGLQKAGSVIPGDYYSTDVNNFYKSQMGQEAEQETLSWIKSFANGINETVNDSSTWEEVFIGGLSGGIGMPSIRSVRSKDGNLRSPIIFKGGVYGEYKEYKEELARSQELAKQLNNRVQSPEFLNYYRGLIRHNKYQEDMNRAVKDNDKFNFDNAEHAQFVSDIIMFDSAGRLEDLRAIIGEASDFSDENLKSIAENTTSVDESGKKTGPFVDNSGNPMYATEEGKKQMIEKLTQTKDNMLETIDNYRRTKSDIEVMTGGSLSDEQLSEMTWMKTQIDNWTKRAREMTPLVKKSLLDMADNMEAMLSTAISDAAIESETAGEASDRRDPIEDTGRFFNKHAIGLDRIQQLRQLASMSDKKLAALLTSPKNVKFTEGVIAQIAGFGSDIISNLDKQNVLRLLQDLPRIGKGIETYRNKLDEYLKDPSKLAEDQARATEETRQEIQNKKSQDIRTKLSSATSLADFRTAVNEEEDSELSSSVIDELAEGGNEVAKDYKDTLQYDRELKATLSSQGEDAQTVQDVLALWQQQFDHAENLDQIANPNSVFINNEEAFMEDSEGDVDMAGSRFQNARYALQRAMAKVSDDIKFRGRFSEEYKKPADEPAPKRTTSRETTGDSGTSTVPHENPNPATPAPDLSGPVGNVTADMVAAENKQANDAVETPKSLDKKQTGQRKYYRPVIPEFHIEASKEGDFRPFDVVIAEREGENYTEIYKHLKDNGAFDYVNSGKLKVGDTIRFMIDPEFEESVKGKPWHTAPTVFMVTSDGQIVGSIDEGASIANYEGLERVVKQVRDEYEANRSGTDTSETSTIENFDDIAHITITSQGYSTDEGHLQEWSKKVQDVRTSPDGWGEANGLTYYKRSVGGRGGDNTTIWFKESLSDKGKEELAAAFDKTTSRDEESKAKLLEIINRNLKGKQKKPSTERFTATPQVKVSKIMVGKVPYTSEERSLAAIPGVADSDAKPVFGIIKNGMLTTNGKVDDRLIMKPFDMSNKEGRLYLLIPNAAGTYSPVAVRVKHFNRQEFNPDDATIATTSVGKNINEAIDKLVEAESKEDVNIAFKELSNRIYLGKGAPSEREVNITYFDAEAGSGIVIGRKVRKPDGSYEMVTIDGKEQIKEEHTTIYFQTNKKAVDIGSVSYSYEAVKKQGGDLSLFGKPRDSADIRKDIVNALLKLNMPLQVDASKINESGYNDNLIGSNMLTSNIREAEVEGSWFITEYIDNQGNPKGPIAPSPSHPGPIRRGTPARGSESITQGTRVVVSGTPYIVDLKHSVAINEKTGEKRAFSAFDSMELIDMAWAQETFGDATEASVMTENKIITPRGAVLDRNTGHYITGAEAQRIKDKLAGKSREKAAKTAQSDKVVADIYDNQKKVDKTRTDSQYYYILEDDGQYHQYSRVHSRLGDNWLGERTNTGNSERALSAGSAVDQVIRDFFTGKTPSRPENLSEKAFSALISRLTEIKANMEQMGETFMADNIVLFQKYPDGTRVAGEVDILSRDKNGDFKIYDVKTSKYSFSGKFFNEKSSMQRMSTKDYYTLQLSAYQNLFESQYGVRPVKLAILPFVLTYDKDNVTSITQEKGIPITYNPAVNVPLVSTVQAQQQQETLPIFDSSIETMNPENRVLPENAFEEGGEIGYYEKDGKLYTGYLKKVGEVEVTYGSGQKDKVPIYLTKIRDRGLGREGELGSTSEYLAVFPNGKAISPLSRNDSSDDHAAKIIMDAFSAKPEKVLQLSNEKTQIHNPRMLEEMENKLRDRQYSSESSQPSGASAAIQMEDSVNPHDDEFEDDLVLREVDDSSRKLWNKEKELAWLKRVLPQLSEQDRIKIVEGLIQVAENGPVAWGMFSNGIMTLSDIAAEGTAYHEAFHVVFDLMMTSKERGNILIEARKKWGRKSYSEIMELLAEDFREYVTSQEDKGWGSKILNFFKNLLVKIQNWGRIKPSLTTYYRAINRGDYSKRNFNNPITRNGQYKFSLESALRSNPFASELISKLSSLGYVLSGSPAYSLQGTVYRKSTDFHDIDLIENESHTDLPIDVLNRMGYSAALVNAFSNIRTHVVTKYKIRHNSNGSITVVTPEAEFGLKQVQEGLVPDTMMVDFIREPVGGVKTHRVTVNGIDLTIQDAEQIEDAKLDMSRDKDISDLAHFGGTDNDTRFRVIPNSSWSAVDNEAREALEAKGWTQEKFNSISQAERDQAVKCVTL